MSWLRPIDAWFASSVLPHETELLRQARRWATGDDEARDLVHEAYAELLQLERWDHIGNPAAYAVRIMRNTALQRMRRARIVPMRQFAALEEGEHPDPAPDSFAVAAGRDALKRMMIAIDDLPPACRRVVLLRKFEELPPRAIAERLGLSLSTVEKHLARGILLLSRALRDMPVRTDPPGPIAAKDSTRRQA